MIDLYHSGMDIANASPIEIDTELARIWGEQQKVEGSIASYLRTLARWDEEAAATRAKGGEPFQPQYKSYKEGLAEEEAKLKNLLAEAKPYEDEYNRRPWRRFFLVTNQNGHIHTSMHCSTCFPDTLFAWMPQYSAMTDEEIVALEAYRCCTVCMPIAPAEQKAAREAYNKQQREAKAAERQAKKDAKAAKARERAVKLVDKAQKEIETLGGTEAFARLTGSDVYKKGFDMQQTVYEVLSYLKDVQEGDPRPVYRPNEHVEAELRERGLMA